MVVNLEKLENNFLDLCQKYPSGLTQQMIEVSLDTSMDEVVKVINNLLRQGKITITQNGDDTTSYKEVPPEDQQKFRGLTIEDFTIYQLIEQSSNTGAWTRELKNSSGFQQVQITKILKLLESRKLIKSVKTIQSGRKKVFMLYNMEPSRDLTGGQLYADQSYDNQYIQIMKMHIKTFVDNKGAVSFSEIITYLRKIAEETTSQSLGPEDIQALVNTVIYDGDIEEMRDTRVGSIIGRRPGVLYKPTKTPIPVNNFCNMPCGTCPVFDLCCDDGLVSPKRCIYFKQYLEQDEDNDYDF